MFEKTKNKHNVLFLLPSLKRAGAETQMVDLINNTSRQEFHIHVVTFQNDFSLLERLNTKDINYQYIPRKSKFAISYLFSLRDFIKKHNITLIHCTLQFSLLVAWLSIAMLFFKKKPKLICAIHTTKNVNIKRELTDRFLYSKLLRRCVEVIFVCKAQKDYWLLKYPYLEEISSVVYNGIDSRRYDPDVCIEQGAASLKKLNIPLNCPIISCIAGFRPEKGHDILLRVFSRLPEEYHLILAGDGPLKLQMEDYAANLGVMVRVHFLGNLSDVRPVLAASTVTVLASTAVETFSIAMLESLAMDTPVVAPDIGGLSEAISLQSENGAVYPIGDENAFFNALLSINTPIDKQKIGTIRSCVIKYFDNEVMVKEIVKIIKKNL